MFGRMRQGQAMVEYMIVFAILLSVVFVLQWLVRVTERHADRTESLVTSDCP